MIHADEIFDTLESESQKLENQISDISLKQDLPLHEIVGVYYQVMNLSSMINVLKQQDIKKHKHVFDKLRETDILISEKFNSIIHPKIMIKLSSSIETMMKHLSSNASEQKSKQEIENEAKLYEKLRQSMSTKEFIEQYDKGLSND